MAEDLENTDGNEGDVEQVEVVEDENVGDEQYRKERKAEREAEAKARADKSAKSTTDSPDARTKQTVDGKPTDKTDKTQSTFNAETSVTEVQKRLEQITKSYEELRSEFTRRTQGESSLKKEYADLKTKFDGLIKSLNKKDHDPQQFISELQTKGIEALNPYLEEILKEKEAGWQEQTKAERDRSLKLEHQVERMKRMLDVTNFPDFGKLEPKIVELAKDPKTPIDWTLPVSDIYDALYKLAQGSSSEEAVKLAEEAARKKAEAGLAKEAATGVAGGGNKGGKSEPNYNKMSLADHRKALVEKFGDVEAE